MNTPGESREHALMRNTFYAFFVSGACTQPLGSFIPFLRDSYGFDYDFAGILLSCQSLGNLITALLAGVLPLYLGRRKSVLLTSIWMAVAYLIFAGGIGFAPIVVTACLMTGISRGGNTTFCNTMVSTVPLERSTQSYNLLHGSYALGALISPLVLVALSVQFPVYGWRMTAVVLAVVALTQVGVYSRMELPQEAPRGVQAADYSFLKIKQFWLGAMMMFCYISTEYAVVGWLVTYFQDTGILSDSHAQLMNSLFWATVFVGRMAGSKIATRYSRSTMLLVDGIGVVIFFVVMLSSTSATMVVIALMGLGLFMATISPTAFAFGSDCIKGNDFGCSMMGFIGSTGGIITPALVGIVASAAGIQAGMTLVACFAGLLLAIILVSVLSVRAPKVA